MLLLLLICSGGKGTPLHDALLGLQSWGYGEDMVSSGLDNLQLPSLRMQTNGHRHVVMLPVEKLSLYIQSCQKGQRPSYKDLLSFVSSVQPQTLASYLSMFPNEIQHGILSKHTLAYVPPGWLLMEKVFFA